MHIDYYMKEPEVYPRVQYFGFWPGFYHEPRSSAKLRWFFDELFARQPSLESAQMEVHSVFAHNKKEVVRDQGKVVVHFSGEPHSDPPENYDLNLVMEETNVEKKIVFCPLFSIGSYEHNLWHRYWAPRLLMPKMRFCAFVVSNPGAPVRNRFFEKLNQYKRVDSCGLAMNNCGFCAPREGYFEFLQQFKFMICFENTSKPFYLTEKLHNAYLGGTIPIYWGCPNSQTWLNPKSFLYLEDESEEAMDRLIARIIELDNDPAKYREMHEQFMLPSGTIPEIMTIEKMREGIAQVLA